MRSAVVALVAAAIVACSAPITTTAPASTASVLRESSPSAAPTRATAAAPTPAQGGPITDIAQVFRPITIGWQPKTTTAIVASANDDGTFTLVAVPVLAGSAPIPLVTFPALFPSWFWSVRGDGSALAVDVPTDGGMRIAVYEPGSGTSRWLTDPAPALYWPVWSTDGGTLFYAIQRQDLSGAVYRIDANGTNKREIATLERLGGLSEMTPDGRAITWSRAQAGGSAEILDVSTGKSRHLEDVAQIVSWRTAQPRALLSVGGCCAGRPGGSLVAYDDAALTSRVIAERTALGVGWGVGAWEPGGDRIAAVRFDNTPPYAGSLVILSATGAVQSVVVGATAIGQLTWLDEGVLFTAGRMGDFASDLMVLRLSGASPAPLFNDGRIQRFAVVRP